MNAKDIADIQKTLKQCDARLTQYHSELAALRGDGEYVVYTGTSDCPIYVKFTPSFGGVLPGFGLWNATRISSAYQARALAYQVRNGNGERGSFMLERAAYEQEILNITGLCETLSIALEKAEH